MNFFHWWYLLVSLLTQTPQLIFIQVYCTHLYDGARGAREVCYITESICQCDKDLHQNCGEECVEEEDLIYEVCECKAEKGKKKCNVVPDGRGM